MIDAENQTELCVLSWAAHQLMVATKRLVLVGPEIDLLPVACWDSSRPGGPEGGGDAGRNRGLPKSRCSSCAERRES